MIRSVIPGRWIADASHSPASTDHLFDSVVSTAPTPYAESSDELVFLRMRCGVHLNPRDVRPSSRQHDACAACSGTGRNTRRIWLGIAAFIGISILVGLIRFG